MNRIYDRRKKLAMVPLIPCARDGLPSRLRVLNEPNLTRPMAADKFRLVERGFQAADGIGLAERHRHLQHLLGERRDVRDARAAAAEKNTRAQIIEEPGLLQILRDELEDFLEPQRHDAAQMLDVDRFERQAEFVGDGDGLALGIPRPPAPSRVRA